MVAFYRPKRYGLPLPGDPSGMPMLPMPPQTGLYPPPASAAATLAQPPVSATLPPEMQLTAEEAMQPPPASAAQQIDQQPPIAEVIAQQREKMERQKAEDEELEEIERETKRLKATTKLRQVAKQASEFLSETETAKIADIEKREQQRESRIQAEVSRLKEPEPPSPTPSKPWLETLTPEMVREPGMEGQIRSQVLGGATERAYARDPEGWEAGRKERWATEKEKYPHRFAGTPEARELTGRMLDRRGAVEAVQEARQYALQEKKRLDQPPTAWDFMEHERTLAEIEAPLPEAPEADYRLRKDRLTTVHNEIIEFETELTALGEVGGEPWIFGKDEWQAKKERIDEIMTRLNTLKAERRNLTGMGEAPDISGEATAQLLAIMPTLPPDLLARVRALLDAGETESNILDALRLQGVIK